MVDKKRSTYKPGNGLDFPEQILDRKKFGYRWINADKLSAASDGYEPRGWGLFKDSAGKPIHRGDVVLAQMPIDQFEAMCEYKEEQRIEQTRFFSDQQAVQDAELDYEFKKKGGKVKYEFTQN